jgi:hypothetical protein
MTQEITQDIIKSISTTHLELVKHWIADEEKARSDKHKQETVTRIKELARSINVGLKIERTRGRTAKNSIHQGHR